MKGNLFILVSTLLFSAMLNACSGQKPSEYVSIDETIPMNTIHQFTVEDIEGNPYDFAALSGKKIIIVNVASYCGLTPQYKDLQALYDRYKDKNLVIIGFPANNFLSQEPGSNESIQTFCSAKYGVTFPMMAKISVKGDKQHPIYTWLTSEDQNGVETTSVGWNFQKYLINEDGTYHAMVDPRASILEEEVINGLKTNSPLSPASSLAILTWRDSLPQDPDEKELGSVS